MINVPNYCLPADTILLAKDPDPQLYSEICDWHALCSETCLTGEQWAGDLIYIDEDVTQEFYKRLCVQVEARKTRTEVCTVLASTYGGDLDIAFDIGTYIAAHYKSVSFHRLLIPSAFMSLAIEAGLSRLIAPVAWPTGMEAGTLFKLFEGADEFESEELYRYAFDALLVETSKLYVVDTPRKRAKSRIFELMRSMGEGSR